MKKTVLILFGLMAAVSRSDGAITREQLLSMARGRVDPKVMKALIERDCVDFDVDASNVTDLSRELPPEVIEVAIRCRQAVPKTTPTVGIAAEALPPPTKAQFPPAAASQPQPSAPTSASSGEIRVRAQFIGESGALTCACFVDGEPFATLAKPAQGEFGEAVPRTKIGQQSGFTAVPAGHHKLLFRCDPHAQEVTFDLDIPAGERRTVEVKETTLRHWRLGKIDTK